MSLDAKIRLINESDLEVTSMKLGSSRFGTCLIARFPHFIACKKVLEHINHHALCKEVNILSKSSLPSWNVHRRTCNCNCLPSASHISFGRIISSVLEDRSLKDLSKQCMLYHSSIRPTCCAFITVAENCISVVFVVK